MGPYWRRSEKAVFDSANLMMQRFRQIFGLPLAAKPLRAFRMDSQEGFGTNDNVVPPHVALRPPHPRHWQRAG